VNSEYALAAEALKDSGGVMMYKLIMTWSKMAQMNGWSLSTLAELQ
jgi:hypothetical protein